MLSAENFGSNGTEPDGVVVDGPFASEPITNLLRFHDLTLYVHRLDIALGSWNREYRTLSL